MTTAKWRVKTRWVVLTLLGVALAIPVAGVMKFIVPHYQDEWAAAQLERSGASVSWGYPPELPRFVRRWEPKIVQRVKSVVLSAEQLAGLERLVCRFGCLERLIIDGGALAAIDTEGLAGLAKISTIHTLCLGNCTGNDIQVSRLITYFPNVRCLVLDVKGMSGTALRSLTTLRYVWHLELGNRTVDDSAVEWLTRIRTLTELDVRGTRISPEGFRRPCDEMAEWTEIRYYSLIGPTRAGEGEDAVR